jgi:hypothetical protein
MSNSDLLPATPGSYAIWLDGSAIWREYQGQDWRHFRDFDIVAAYASILGWTRYRRDGYRPVLACLGAPSFDVEDTNDVVLIVMPDNRVHSLMGFPPDEHETPLYNRMFNCVDEALGYYRWKWFAWAQEHKTAERPTRLIVVSHDGQTVH